MKYMTSQGNDEDKEDDYRLLSDIFNEKFKNIDLSVHNDYKKNIRESIESISERVFIGNETRALILAGSKQRHITSLKATFIKEAIKLKYSLIT